MQIMDEGSCAHTGGNGGERKIGVLMKTLQDLLFFAVEFDLNLR